MEHMSGCLICGAELTHHEDARQLECCYCGRLFESRIICEAGHYIPDVCHSLPANDLIKQYCGGSESANPLKMALDLMKHPAVKMHGPEHHFLVPAVLLSAYYNMQGNADVKLHKLAETEKRDMQILGGFCGFYGNCGAAVGTGIFLSLITDTTPLSVETWRLCNMLTSQSLMAIALEGGPRCCKRNTYLALIEATRFMKEHMGVSLDFESRIECAFTDLNKECLKDKCPFFAVENYQ